MKLLGIGKHRFLTISKAIKDGLERCPMDNRFIPVGKRPQRGKREIVFDFFHSLYEQAAERLPDGNSSSSNKRPRQGDYKFDDPNMSRSEVRHLPPGTFQDYFRLCQMENPDLKISRQLFTSVTRLKNGFNSSHKHG